jgi:hypothetical protein
VHIIAKDLFGVSRRGLLAVVLSAALVTPEPLLAQPANQTAPPAAANPVPQPQGNNDLKIIVLVGEGAVHRIPLRLVTDPVVEIRDRNDFPVEGATVVFTLPESGPGGSFSGQRVFRARSDASGQAGAFGFQPNQLPGKFQIDVAASLGTRQARAAVIHQSNSLEAIASTVDRPKSKMKKWLIISGIASAAVIAVVLLTRGDSTPEAAPPSVVLRPGTVSVGGPR